MNRRQFHTFSSWISALCLMAVCCPALLAQTVGQQAGFTKRARFQNRGSSPPLIPLTSGNWSQIGELVPSAIHTLYGGSVLFGEGLAMSGNTILATPEVTGIPSGEAGYIFQEPAKGWSNMIPQAILSTPGSFNTLTGVALSNDTAAICQTNALYVFAKPTTGWANMGPTAVLSTTDSAYCDIVYGMLSISGDTIVMGSLGGSAAYVFVKPASGWANMTQTAKLTASDPQKDSLFGYTTTVSADTVMVGSPGAGSNAKGKVYVYVKPASGWADMTETAQLSAPNAPEKAELGTGVFLDGDSVLVSSVAQTAYIFTKPAGGWTNSTPTATLTAADGASSKLAIGVGLSGKIAAVGAPFRGNQQNYDGGGVYIFNQPKGGWKNMTSNVLLTPSNCHYFCEFGQSIVVQGNLVVSGAPATMNYGGAVYVFELP